LSWFLNKLVEKRQSEQQQKQARHSITLFYRMQHQPVASYDATYSVDSLQAEAACRNVGVAPTADIDNPERLQTPQT